MRKQRGFSLIEALISLVLISILLTGTAQLIIQSLAIKQKAEEQLTTANLAAAKLEHLKSLSYESDDLKAGYFSEQLKVDVSQEIFRREWSIEDAAPNLKKIELRTFSEVHPHKRAELVLYLCRKLGF